MNIYLLSTLLAHSPSCCFAHHIKLKEDYYKWRLLLYYANLKNNSKFRFQIHSYRTTFKLTKADFNHKAEKSGKRISLNSQLLWLCKDPEVLHCRPQLGKHHLDKPSFFIPIPEWADKAIQLSNHYTTLPEYVPYSKKIQNKKNIQEA